MKFELKRKNEESANRSPSDASTAFETAEKSSKEVKKAFSESELWDRIRVVNVRGDDDFRATEDERVIVCHRGNPVLGNRHPMRNKSLEERYRVIAENKRDLDEDLRIGGPMSAALNEAGRFLADGGNLALQCFCAPAKCHAENYAPVIVEIAKNELKRRLETKKTSKP